jgi:hypothetical protein
MYASECCVLALRACAAAVLAGIRGKIEMFNFSAATLERAGLPSSAATNIPPFVVIASNDINQVGAQWVLRSLPPTVVVFAKYQWCS